MLKLNSEAKPVQMFPDVVQRTLNSGQSTTVGEGELQ